uniref:Uncharacterized protein n=1 Tax=Myoviridae sp. ctj9o3 TaxID=2826688 RepID=A0A8S5MC46_9CAUD|nr:MAG TPA: hypothetical protein [Myoviridae sp. ctj9o3]
MLKIAEYTKQNKKLGHLGSKWYGMGYKKCGIYKLEK